MTTWPQLDQLAPCGKIMLNGQLMPAGILIRNDYSALSTQVIKTARDMVTEEVEYTHTNDGRIQRNVIYDVYFDSDNNLKHCLNVFGAKMLRDYLEEQPAQMQGEDNEIRFNYTGL